MLPLSLLKAAENHPMLIELKNGDTYNGRLVSCNVYMNICLKDVICTSKDGDRFWKMPECYIRGNSIKYLRIPDEVIDLVVEEEQRERKAALRGVAKGGRTAGRIGGGREGGRGDHVEGRHGGRGGRGGRGEGSGRDGGRGRGGRGDYRGGGREGGYQGRGGGRGGEGRGRYQPNQQN
eukprot:gene809-862_t